MGFPPASASRFTAVSRRLGDSWLQRFAIRSGLLRSGSLGRPNGGVTGGAFASSATADLAGASQASSASRTAKNNYPPWLYAPQENPAPIHPLIDFLTCVPGVIIIGGTSLFAYWRFGCGHRDMPRVKGTYLEE
eukprot:GHVT01088460.1.p1 GENE.GHVT01088460.1~~GHVT01088460.1.p1  ORF type:complete len:134 (+),score=13.12 GHVT01088460.1:324-725(+)